MRQISDVYFSRKIRKFCKKSPIVTDIEKSCSVHADKSIEYYCTDHSIPCCTACVCTAHRKCFKVETAIETAKRLRKTEHSKLSVAMKDLENELTAIKQELENNVSDIEETSESLSANVEELYTNIMKHIEKNRNEYLNKLSKKTKECKKELEENAKSVGEKILYLKICRKLLNGLKEETEDDKYIGKYHEISKKYTMLKDFYSKSKTGLKLVNLRCYSNSRNTEHTSFLGDVGVVTVKEYYSKERLSKSSASDVRKSNAHVK